MIINIRVDHTLADIETMEKVSKDLKELFSSLKEQIDVKEYIEINTCNRYEYFLYAEDYNELDLDCENKYVIIQYSDEAVLHLFRMTSGLESMIIGEDQILGQVKDAKLTSEREGHCGKKLDAVFTKAIHVGQVVRNKTKINQGSISIGSAAVDLAEENLGDLQDKNVLVIGAGKMGTLVAKALAEKNLKAIFVANRTYYKAIKLAEELDVEGYRVMNRAEAIADCDDKARTYLKLKRHNISQPLTICSPLKYFPDGIIDEGYIDKACELTGFPMIIKECFGSFGQQVYLVHSREEMTETILNIGDKPYIIQKFIEGAAGHDKRLQVVGGQVVASMDRENKNDFRANISNGGTMSPYTPDEEEAKLAIKVCDILGLDFAGVDILRDSDGSLYVCEVNSNAHFKNLYDCTRVNVAKEIINYAVSHNL